MKKLFLKLFICFFFIISSANAGSKFYANQIFVGKINLSHLTNTILPEGEWIVTSSEYSYKRKLAWEEITLVLLDKGSIKSVLKLQFPQNGGNGNAWHKGKNNACDDFYNQRSNFHVNTSKRSGSHSNVSDESRTDGISTGYCMAVWEKAKHNLIDYETIDYLKINNISEPKELIWMQHVYYTQFNQIKVSFALNPLHSDISTSELINKAIYLGRVMAEDNGKSLNAKKLLDLSILTDLFYQKKEEIIKLDINNTQAKTKIKDKLEQLKLLLDEGLINQDQYDTKSAKLLEDF